LLICRAAKTSQLPAPHCAWTGSTRPLLLIIEESCPTRQGSWSANAYRCLMNPHRVMEQDQLLHMIYYGIPERPCYTPVRNREGNQLETCRRRSGKDACTASKPTWTSAPTIGSPAVRRPAGEHARADWQMLSRDLSERHKATESLHSRISPFN